MRPVNLSKWFIERREGDASGAPRANEHERRGNVGLGATAEHGARSAVRRLTAGVDLAASWAPRHAAPIDYFRRILAALLPSCAQTPYYRIALFELYVLFVITNSNVLFYFPDCDKHLRRGSRRSTKLFRSSTGCRRGSTSSDSRSKCP